MNPVPRLHRRGGVKRGFLWYGVKGKCDAENFVSTAWVTRLTLRRSESNHARCGPGGGARLYTLVRDRLVYIFLFELA